MEFINIGGKFFYVDKIVSVVPIPLACDQEGIIVEITLFSGEKYIYGVNDAEIKNLKKLGFLLAKGDIQPYDKF